MIKVHTELHCRNCNAVIKSGVSKGAMIAWAEMVSWEFGWKAVDSHGFKRYLCPCCQLKNEGADNE